MDINQLNKAYAEQYFKDHNLEERYKTPQTKPLSDEELFEILKSLPYSDAVRLPEGFRLFARAIEERHGIK